MRFSAEAQPHTFAANVAALPTGSVFAFDVTRARAAAFRPHGDAGDAFLFSGGSDIIDLTERFRAADPARQTDTEFQAYVDRLLAEKPQQWPEFAFWGVVTAMFTGGILGICACLAG